MVNLVFVFVLLLHMRGNGSGIVNVELVEMDMEPVRYLVVSWLKQSLDVFVAYSERIMSTSFNDSSVSSTLYIDRGEPRTI